MTATVLSAQEQTDQPEQRVQQSEGERPDQQRRHRPERPEQPRVAVRVVVGRVGQVTCEAQVRRAVTLGAGLDDVAPAEP